MTALVCGMAGTGIDSGIHPDIHSKAHRHCPILSYESILRPTCETNVSYGLPNRDFYWVFTRDALLIYSQ